MKAQNETNGAENEARRARQLLDMVLMCLEQNDRKQAVVHWKQAQALAPHAALVYAVGGLIALLDGDPKNAIAHYQQAVSGLPEATVERQRLAILYDAVARRQPPDTKKMVPNLPAELIRLRQTLQNVSLEHFISHKNSAKSKIPAVTVPQTTATAAVPPMVETAAPPTFKWLPLAAGVWFVLLLTGAVFFVRSSVYSPAEPEILAGNSVQVVDSAPDTTTPGAPSPAAEGVATPSPTVAIQPTPMATRRPTPQATAAPRHVPGTAVRPAVSTPARRTSTPQPVTGGRLPSVETGSAPHTPRTDADDDGATTHLPRPAARATDDEPVGPRFTSP